MKEKLLKIINTYDISNQLKKFNEESYELIESIIRYDEANINYFEGHGYYAERELQEHIAEEIADCLVMLSQFQHYYNITDEQIEEIMSYKVDRQLERIEKEKEC